MRLFSVIMDLENQIFRNTKVLMKNKDTVKGVIQKIAIDGQERLQIISDFDYTLSRFCHRGQPCDSTYRTKDHLQTDCVFKTAYLRRKYLPYYWNSRVTEAKREEVMQTWLEQSHNLMKKFRVCHDDIRQMVKASSVSLRTDVVPFLLFASRKNIPVTIFSAGLTLVVEEVLRLHGCWTDNITIIGNELLLNNEVFSNLGQVVGVREPVVDGMNKSKIAISRAEDFDKHHNRPNVIVIGDSVGDSQVADKMANVKNTLKLGFFVSNQSDTDLALQQYLNAFDIVVVDQEKFTVVDKVVRLLLSSASEDLEVLSSTEDEEVWPQKAVGYL